MTMQSEKVKDTLDFLKAVNKLKGVARSGWPLHGVPNGESVPDHSFQVALMAMFLAPKVGVDQNKSVLMALIHDIGEVIVGDVITERGNTKLLNHIQKQINERDAVKLALGKIKWMDIWNYMMSTSPAKHQKRDL